MNYLSSGALFLPSTVCGPEMLLKDLAFLGTLPANYWVDDDSPAFFPFGGICTVSVPLEGIKQQAALAEVLKDGDGGEPWGQYQANSWTGGAESPNGPMVLKWKWWVGSPHIPPCDSQCFAGIDERIYFFSGMIIYSC